MWEGPRIVFTVPEGTWANALDGAGAPEVHPYQGKYYLFVTLLNRDAIFAEPPEVWRASHRRGTTVARADTPTGPYELLRTEGPHTPHDFMTAEGTLYLDPQNKPWMVYCHEWDQVIDGTIEAIPLTGDLSGTDGDPIYLFKASDGPWLAAQQRVTRDQRIYVSDGPQVFRTQGGQLLMLWSSHATERGYLQTVARSRTGQLQGPWEQLEPLVGDDSGQGMLFRTFEGQLMMVLQHPFGPRGRARLYDMQDAGDRLRVLRRREDLDTRAVSAEEGGRRGSGRPRR
jgi:hypothetical protein